MASSSENAGAPTEETQAPPQNPSEEAEEPQTLERAQELFDLGSKAIEDGDAVDCLSRALEIRVAHYGELAPECASTYYKYGAALLYKYQDESDPLGSVPKSAPKEESVKSTTGKNDSEGSKASASNVEDAAPSEKGDAEEGQNPNGKDQEDGNDENDHDDIDGGDEKAGDEDDSDLDLAWKMLDVARVIVEKSPDNILLKVKIFSALGEVSLEMEKIDTSLGDYLKALALLEQLSEPDHRQIMEVNFRICLLYELACKNEDAIPYCETAMSSCKSRIQRLKNSKDALLAGKDDASAAEGGSVKALEDELESLTGILSDLDQKLEDLKQAMSAPRSCLTDIINLVAMKATGGQKDNAMPRAASFTSSQMAVSSNGFDSSTVSTAGTAGSTGSTVTDLGVVGRGVKRASVKPISAELASKEPALDSPSPQVDSSNKVLSAQNLRVLRPRSRSSLPTSVHRPARRRWVQ